jgi:hypothetical protein
MRQLCTLFNITLCQANAIFSTNSFNISTDSFKLILQADGNLVIYDGQKIAIWAASTESKDSVKPIVQNDGNLILNDVWTSNKARSLFHLLV